MAKLTVIFGPPGSGKTSTARNLTIKKKVLWINGYEVGRPFYLQGMYDSEPDAIIVDECPIHKIDILVSLANQETAIVEKPAKPEKEISVPKIYVILSNELDSEQVLSVVSGRGFQLIQRERKEVSDV